MTFPIPQGRGDPRVLCGMLAEQALTQIDAAPQLTVPDTAATICLMNLMRLLEKYRHGVMQAVAQPVGILEGRGRDPFDWVVPEEDPMQSLQVYLEVARAKVYGEGSNKEEVVTKVRRVLRRRLTGRKIDATEAKDAKEFFVALIYQIEHPVAHA